MLIENYNFSSLIFVQLSWMALTTTYTLEINDLEWIKDQLEYYIAKKISQSSWQIFLLKTTWHFIIYRAMSFSGDVV